MHTSSHRDVDNSMLTSGDHCFGFPRLDSYRFEVVCLSGVNDRVSYSDPVLLPDEPLLNVNIAKSRENTKFEHHINKLLV